MPCPRYRSAPSCTSATSTQLFDEPASSTVIRLSLPCFMRSEVPKEQISRQQKIRQLASKMQTSPDEDHTCTLNLCDAQESTDQRSGLKQGTYPDSPRLRGGETPR